MRDINYSIVIIVTLVRQLPKLFTLNNAWVFDFFCPDTMFYIDGRDIHGLITLIIL